MLLFSAGASVDWVVSPPQAAIEHNIAAIRKRQIYVAALANMLCDLEEIELKESIVENVQPELPKLKNNDQRKEFLRNYEEWGVWYCDEKIDAVTINKVKALLASLVNGSKVEYIISKK